MTGRPALLRWVRRIVRLEWRHHVLVTALMALGVAGAVVAVTTTTRLQWQPPHEFESETAVILPAVDSDAARQLKDVVSAVHRDHPNTAVDISNGRGREGLALTAVLPPPGPGDRRHQLLAGTWPTSTGEVALTPAALTELSVLTGHEPAIGDTIILDDRRLTVTGLWEKTFALDASEAMVVADALDGWPHVEVHVPLGDAEAAAAYRSVGQGADALFVHEYQVPTSVSPSTVAATYAGATLLAVQLAVLSSAGFMVLADRRRRQLGVLSAMGAGPAQLGSVMRLIGLVCGLWSSLIGLVVGVLLSGASTPLVQRATARRIETWDLPWVYFLPALPLALLIAVMAAWWPARAARSTSVAEMVSAHGARRWNPLTIAGAGAIVLAAGAWGMNAAAGVQRPGPVVAAVLAVVVGAALLVPALVSLLGTAGGRMPLPIRIGWRDISRHRGRAIATVIAAAIAIALPVGMATVIASGEKAWVPSWPGNAVGLTLGADPAERVDLPPAEVEAVLTPVFTQLPGSTLHTVEYPADPDGPTMSGGERFVPGYAIRIPGGGNNVYEVAYADIDLLTALGVEPPADGTDVVVFGTQEIELPGDPVVERRDPVAFALPDVIVLTDLPGIDRSTLAMKDWVVTRSTPFSEAELIAARAASRVSDRSDTLGVWFTEPSEPDPFLAIRLVALTVAGVLGAGVVAVAVALLRLESQGEARTLASLGATGSVTRRSGAATAVGVTAVATLLGAVVIAVIFHAIHINEPDDFPLVVPGLELVGAGVVLPALTGCLGWLMSASNPSARSVTRL